MGYVIVSIPIVAYACISLYLMKRKRNKLIKYMQENVRQVIMEIENKRKEELKCY